MFWKKVRIWWFCTRNSGSCRCGTCTLSKRSNTSYLQNPILIQKPCFTSEFIHMLQGVMRQQGHGKKKNGFLTEVSPHLCKRWPLLYVVFWASEAIPPLECLLQSQWEHDLYEPTTWRLNLLVHEIWNIIMRPASCLEGTSGKNKTHMLIGYLHLLTSILNITTRENFNMETWNLCLGNFVHA